jgi:chloride channel protein, CIC family
MTSGTGTGKAGGAGRRGPEQLPLVGSWLGWLRGSRGGLFVIALVVGAGSGLGAVGFRYLIYFFTWLATGHSQFGQDGHVGSSHLPWLGLGFFVVIPVVGGLIYGPLIYRYAREARGHGVPEVMLAVAENGGRIRPQVSAVKAVASALCIGVGGSVGREGPIVQIGSALASSLGQWVRMPENRMRILVACGAAGGIAATFNAPITGVFFGVELILREFSIEAIFTVMLSAMVADLVSREFLGSAPFLSGLPSGIALHHMSSYLLVVALAVVAALLGLAFKNVLYATEDICDRLWKNRPEWARPAVGGVALGLLLLVIPQMYGVGYPVMYKAVGGSYALWFLIVLAAAKMIATSLTIGIGGSGGVFAPSLFIGATSGMAFGEIANHALGPAAGQPALYAVVAMGAVFASAARGPLTAVASVVEMTGDYTLTLPVMLAVAIATALSRALSYGTIYTTKLLRRGTDIDRAPAADPLGDLTVADAMRPVRLPGTAAPPGQHGAALPGPVASEFSPQVLFASEPIADALRQLARYGRDGLPVLSADGQDLQGWITSQNLLQAVARRLSASRATPAQAQLAASSASPAAGRAPSPLPGYQIVEIAISSDSSAVGQTLGETRWPPGWIPVSVLDIHTLRDPDPGLTLAPGDRINLLVPRPAHADGQSADAQRPVRSSAAGPAGPAGAAGRGVAGGAAAAEHLVQRRAQAAVRGDDPADHHDQHWDGPEVTADPEDPGADLLIGERREGDPGDVVVDRIPGNRGQEAHRHGQEPHDDVGRHQRCRLCLGQHPHPERGGRDELQPETDPHDEVAGVQQPDLHRLVVLGQVEQRRNVPEQHHEVERHHRDPGPEQPAADRAQRP